MRGVNVDNDVNSLELGIKRRGEAFCDSNRLSRRRTWHIDDARSCELRTMDMVPGLTSHVNCATELERRRTIATQPTNLAAKQGVRISWSACNSGSCASHLLQIRTWSTTVVDFHVGGQF